MKRKKRSTVQLIPIEARTQTPSEFLAQCSLIHYNQEKHQKYAISSPVDLVLQQEKTISWLNIYGLNYPNEFKQIVHQNNLDEFIVNLLVEQNHRNKAIELSNCFFFTLKALVHSSQKDVIEFEQLVFVVGKNFVWSIQEVEGDYFEHIRTRLSDNIGIVRKKKADYLFYLIIEAVIETYYNTYESLRKNNKVKDFSNVTATPEFAGFVEEYKGSLFQLKKIAHSLKDALVRLEVIEFEGFNAKYLMELKDQIALLCDDIDFNLQQLESSINLIINIQNNRLNEVMRTLTVLSVIFIPLTFLAGIYGMNFENMPETKTKNGYFVVLALMLCLTVFIIYYFKKKKWFD